MIRMMFGRFVSAAWAMLAMPRATIGEAAIVRYIVAPVGLD